MNHNKLALFQGKGPYLLRPDGTPDGDLEQFAVGEARAMGNRKGGNEEGQGMPGFFVVGPAQFAWAAEWMHGLLTWQPAERFTGQVFCHQVTSLAWHKGSILRITYTARDGVSPDGLFLVDFVDQNSVNDVRTALDWQMEPFPIA